MARQDGGSSSPRVERHLDVLAASMIMYVPRDFFSFFHFLPFPLFSVMNMVEMGCMVDTAGGDADLG
jgi:hypothetical protein